MAGGPQQRWAAAIDWLNQPVDAAGLGVYRILFGIVALVGVLRFFAYGWVYDLYIAPDYHFPYFGLEWIRPWPGHWMYAHFGVMGLSALAVTVGYRTRIAAALYCISFTYVELIDKATYLNHYYFVSLVSALFVLLPMGAALSLDARRDSESQVRRWVYLLLRIQIGLVYVFAGLAKLNVDWLVQGEPLATWLPNHAHQPLIGPWLSEPWMALAMSWAGAFYDLTIVGWLVWPRSRPYAFFAVVTFHLAVWALFPIGIFSWVMIASSTLFFDPGWPRRWLKRWSADRGARPTASDPIARPALGRLTRWAFVASAAYLVLQVLVPLRHHAYPGPTNWTEEGFRFAWRVMLIEKAGQVEYRVVCRSTGQERIVSTRTRLTPLQRKAMSTQPDMVHDYALSLASWERERGCPDPEVYADAFAALHGRPSQRFVDPNTDLAAEPRGLAPKAWIVPLDESGWLGL